MKGVIGSTLIWRFAIDMESLAMYLTLREQMLYSAPRKSSLELPGEAFTSISYILFPINDNSDRVNCSND